MRLQIIVRFIFIPTMNIKIDGKSLLLSKVQSADKGQIKSTDKHNQDFLALAIVIFKYNCKNMVSG